MPDKRPGAHMAKRRSRAKAAAPETPTCHCLLICDDVLESKARRKLTLVGVVDGVLATKFPALVGGFVVYARLSNIYGDQKVYLEIGRADETGPKLQCPAIVKARDPLGVATIITTVPAIPVDRPGRFMLSLMWHNQAIIQQMGFQIVGATEQEDADDHAG